MEMQSVTERNLFLKEVSAFHLWELHCDMED